MVDWRSKTLRVRHSFSTRPNDHTHPANPSVSVSPVSTSSVNQASAVATTAVAPQTLMAMSTSTASIQPSRNGDVLDPPSDLQKALNHTSTAQSSQSHVPTQSVPSLDATSTGSSMSRVPGAFYIPCSIAQRASANMPPADAAALRRQLAFDALALVRQLPCRAQGWMFVKRDGSKFTSLFRSQWIPFWGELRGGMFLFCDPNSDTLQSYQRPIKLVFTATNCIIDLKNTQSYSQLKVRRSDGQCIILRMASAQEAQQWVVALQTQTFPYTSIRLADFDWITAIGRGASGKVFLVRDNRTNARLALKVIDKSRVFRTHLTFQHVVNERLVLELCSGCPFAIQLRYAFQTDSHLYFATDFYDGGDLFSLLQRNQGRLEERHARRILAEIIFALAWFHERNIVYRDLKPENVVLDGNGHVRLADFGLAKVLKPEHNFLTQTICGTTAYAAPEMLQSKPYNISLDLWCLGVFTYHILTGRTPYNFKGRTIDEMEEVQRTRQVRYPSYLSLEAVSLIRGLFQNDPLRRLTLEEVKRHPFFRGVDWVRVGTKEPHPDDVSRLLVDKGEQDTAVARLAVARAQQLGVESNSVTAHARMDVQEISSMTLDRYLLRNINPEEWRHVSFSDDDDASATAEFPAVIHKKGAEMETWAIAGWAWTCSEASGHASHTHDIPDGMGIGVVERLGMQTLRPGNGNLVSGRRSLQSWVEGERVLGTGTFITGTGAEHNVGVSPPNAATTAPMTSTAIATSVGSAVTTANVVGVDGTATGTSQSSELAIDRGERVVVDAPYVKRHEFGANMDQGGRGSIECRPGIKGLGRRSVETNLRSTVAPDGAPVSGGRWGARGMLNFGRITSSMRDGRHRASLDSARARRSLDRRSLDRRSREGFIRRTDTFQTGAPSHSNRPPVKSNTSDRRRTPFSRPARPSYT